MSEQLVHTPVSEFMSPYLITIDPYENLAAAYEVMQKNQIRRLPVVEDEKLVGILTFKDVLDAKPSDVKHSLNLSEIYELLSTIIVQVAMTEKPVVTYQTDTLGHAAELMLEKKIGGLPVIDANKKLVGLVTESDIFRTIVHKWRDDNVLHSHL